MYIVIVYVAGNKKVLLNQGGNYMECQILKGTFFGYLVAIKTEHIRFYLIESVHREQNQCNIPYATWSFRRNYILRV